MEFNLSNSCDLDKAFLKSKYNTSFNLFNLEKENKTSISFVRKYSSEISEENSTEQSKNSSKSKNFINHSLSKTIPQINLFKKNNLRKDLFGNLIEKGGKHKVSFKDDIKGKYLVEMTLIDTKQNSLRSKYHEKQTAFIEARDKENLNCSGLCNIF